MVLSTISELIVGWEKKQQQGDCMVAGVTMGGPWAWHDGVDKAKIR